MTKLFQKYFSTLLIIELFKSIESSNENTFKELEGDINNIMKEEKRFTFYNGQAIYTETKATVSLFFQERKSYALLVSSYDPFVSSYEVFVSSYKVLVSSYEVGVRRNK